MSSQADTLMSIWDMKPVSELQIIEDELKHQEFLLQTANARIKFLRKKERILKLKIESNGNYGHNCKNWQKNCAGFQNCKYEDICEGNQLRRGFP